MKKKLLSIISCLAIMVSTIGVTTIPVNATTTMNESEPNDTQEEAKLIEANNETIAGDLSGSYTGQFVVKGYTSTSDPDWYKVYLDAGTNYMTCNNNSFVFVILNEDNTYNHTQAYSKTALGITPYELAIPEDGYYYVEITGVTSTQKSYLFNIGGPTYNFDQCTLSCDEDNVTMQKGTTTKTATFDATNSDIPDEAIVFTMNTSGILTTSVKSMKISNSNGKSVTLTPYSWQKTGLQSLNMAANDIWKAEFTYSKNTTFTPKLILFYIYPILP